MKDIVVENTRIIVGYSLAYYTRILRRGIDLARYNCIIWDWNGTLFDDLGICINVMNRILKNRNLPLLNIKRYKQIFGFPVKHYYIQLGFNFVKETFEEISTELIAEYQKQSLAAKLNENCIPTLEYIRNEGIKQVILSASQLENLQEQVSHFEIIDYFDRLLGLDHCHATSKVDIGKRWLEESVFDKKEVLLVGDTLHDYETSCELGCDCILLSSGHQSKERILCLKVPVIESLMQVKHYLMAA